MYTFVDTTVSQGIRAPVEPIDNMSINGTPLNRLIEGYRHLTVTGRGIVGQTVKTTSISGRRGVWIDEYSDDERILEIKYMLEADTSAKLRNRFAKLNKTLRRLASSGFLEITFADEPDYIYYGYFSGADDIEETSLSIISKFTLLIPDGYKKKKPQSSAGVISLVDADEVLPESIVLEAINTTNQIQIINNDKIISFSGSYSPGKDIVISWGLDEITATYDNRSILSELDRFSPLEIFKLKNGDIITAKNARIKQVDWRDERL